MEYTQVNNEEINEMIKSKVLKKMTVVKDVPVKAVELNDEVVNKLLKEGGYKTVVVDNQGKIFVETTNKNINVGDYLVTNQIAGYENSYIIPATKFIKLYTKTSDENIYNPVVAEKTVYLIPKNQNLEFKAPWGESMKIRGEGVIVPDGENFYGINPEEFKATHSEVSLSTVKDMDSIKKNVVKVLSDNDNISSQSLDKKLKN